MKNKKIRIILKIMAICAIVTMFFGTLVFADENNQESQVFSAILEGSEFLVARLFFRNCWDCFNAS